MRPPGVDWRSCPKMVAQGVAVKSFKCKAAVIRTRPHLVQYKRGSSKLPAEIGGIPTLSQNDARLARRAPLGPPARSVCVPGSEAGAQLRIFAPGGEGVLGGASAAKAAVRERCRAPDRRPGEDSAPKRTPSPTAIQRWVNAPRLTFPGCRPIVARVTQLYFAATYYYGLFRTRRPQSRA